MTISQRIVEYHDGSQTLIGELFYPGAMDQTRPAIILFSAFEGRGAFTLNYAQKLAEQGFVTFVADMYGDARIAETIDECMKLLGPFLKDRALVRRRAVLAYRTLCQQPGIDLHHIGAIGFCFGGMCVLELARSGENLRAGVSAHGVLTPSDLPTAPFKTKLLILHGYQDPQVPPSILQVFSEEMKKADVADWTFTFFGDAKHSFTDPKTGTFDPAREKEMGREYNKTVAEQAFRYALDFFKSSFFRLKYSF